MNYGAILKELRAKEQLTQLDIAQKLGINRSTYKDYELQIRIIPINHLNVLSVIYKTSIDYLLGFSNILESQSYNSEINRSLFAQRLKKLRKENKLTQEKLANILNTTHSVISDYENGKKIISTPFLYAICKKYNISADYLLGKVDEPQK